MNERPHHLRDVLLLVASITLIACIAGIFVRSTASGQTDVDEPEYLMTAQSIAQDFDLDISNQLAEQSWRSFHRPGTIAVQAQARADGSALSPHDPLLPILLAAPMALLGWIGAKIALAAMAAALAALTVWVGVRRFGLRAVPTAIVVTAAAVTSPLVVYGQQVYPEIVAALMVMIAVAALTGPLRWRSLALVVLACTTLPWLAVKYVPVAATLGLCAAVALWRQGRRRSLIGLLTAAGVMAAVYLLAHRAIYGGWTVYAAGDTFQSSGEFGVVGFAPDYPARSIRLAGLLTDAQFGLIAWQPAYLLLPAAVAFVLHHRGHRLVLLLPLLVGWLTATYVALTMQGFWWPGRQIIVVLPLAVLCCAIFIDAAGRRTRAIATAAAVWGIGIYLTTLVAGWLRGTTWVFAPTDGALHAPWGAVLPDLFVIAGTTPGSLPAEVVKYVLWLLVLAASAYIGWRTPVTGQRKRSAVSCKVAR